MCTCLAKCKPLKRKEGIPLLSDKDLPRAIFMTIHFTKIEFFLAHSFNDLAFFEMLNPRTRTL